MPRRGCSMPSGGAPCQEGGVLSANDRVVLNANEGGGSMPTRGRGSAQCERGGAQYQRWEGGRGWRSIPTMGGCSVPTVVCAQCQL